MHPAGPGCMEIAGVISFTTLNKVLLSLGHLSPNFCFVDYYCREILHRIS